TIPWVEYEIPGRKTVYAAADAKPAGAGLTMREIDCMDCHNRPSHTYDLPERAVDRSMNSAAISASLPFAKKKAVEILKANHTTPKTARPSRRIAMPATICSPWTKRTRRW